MVITSSTLARIKKRLYLVCLAVGAYLSSQINATKFVALSYEYFNPRQLDIWDHALALFFLLIPISFLPLKKSALAGAFWIFYCFIYFSAIVAGVGLFPNKTEFLFFIGMYAFGASNFFLAANLKIRTITLSAQKGLWDLILILGFITLVVFTWRQSDFNFTLDLESVYDRRLAVRNDVFLIGYLVAPLRLVLPILAVYALQTRKNILWPTLATFGCIALFSYDGTKTALFAPFLLWLILYGLRKKNLPTLLLLCFFLLNLFAAVEHWCLDTTYLIEYGVRRIIIAPGMIATFYWKWASQIQSIQNITFQFGEIIFSNPESNTNTNYLMWGWIKAGWAGVALVALGSGLFVSFFNSYPCRKFPCLGALMASGCMFVWSEQFLHTSLNSSGVALLVCIALLLTLFPRKFMSLAATCK